MDPSHTGRGAAGQEHRAPPTASFDLPTPTTVSPNAPLSSSTSRAHSSASVDAYDQQDVSTILPPSRRSSLSTRRSSAADASLSWWVQRASVQHSAGAELAAAAPAPFALWQFNTSVSDDAKEEPTTAAAPFSWVDRASPAASARTAEPPFSVTRNPFFEAQPADEAAATPTSSSSTAAHTLRAGDGVSSSLRRYRFSDGELEREDRLHEASMPAASVAAASQPAQVSAPPPEDSTVHASRATSTSPTQQQQQPSWQQTNHSVDLDSTNAQTPVPVELHRPYFGAPSSESSASSKPALAGTHVRFSSDVDVVEAASRASTSTTVTTAIAAAAPNPTVERHITTEMYDIDGSDEGEENLGATVNSVRSEGSESSTGGVHRSRRQHPHADRGSVDDPHALPVLLSEDELQLARLKAYDNAVHRSPDGRAGSVGRRAGHGSDGESEDGGATHLDVDVDGESGHALRSGDAGGDETSGGGGGLGPHDSTNDVSTLDFLRDTTTTLLPDAFTNMFATTSSYLKIKTEAMVSAVPQPLRRAMSRTGEGIANVADATGTVLSNVGVYAMRGVPDRVLSPKWKYLIFVDAVNVLRCSLNVNILVAPYIFRMAGLVGGVLLILVMQVVCCYYAEVYFRAKNELKSAGHVIMYGDVPRITFGRWYPTFQLWYDGIALVATVAYAALNMQALLPHMNIKGDAAKALSFIIPSLFCLPFAFMKRARTQPPMMTLASLLIFVSLIMMFTVFPYGSVVSATISTIERDSTVAVLHLFPSSAQEFFVAIGICVFAFTPLRRAVPVERTMQPRRYIALLRVSVLITTVVYVAFGVCAIVSYGSHTCSVLSTSFSNNDTAVEVAVMALLFFAFLFYIPLHMFELGELSDRRVLGWRSIPRYGQAGPNMLRILFLTGSALAAWCIPYYGLLISLSGCLGYSVVAIIVPAALDYVCRARYELLLGRTPRFLDYVITFTGFLFGGMICVVGVVMTVYEMWLVVESGYSTTC